MEIDVEFGDVVEVVDSFTNHSGGTVAVDLDQAFASDEVSYVSHAATGGAVNLFPGEVRWALILGAGQSASLTVWYQAAQCNWPDSVIERLWVNDNDRRDITLDKWLHDLHIGSSYEPHVFAGQQAAFQLQAGNGGGYENNVEIWCAFSPEAPFGDASPPATFVDPTGLTANWELGDLSNSASTSINITADVDPGIPVGTPVPTLCSIQDHTGVLVANTTINQTTVAATLWETTVDSQAWFPGLLAVREMGDTIEVVEELHNRSGASITALITQNFGPSQLSLLDASASHGSVVESPGVIDWTVQIGVGQTVTLTGLYLVEPCLWTDTAIHTVLAETNELREIEVEKTAASLWIDSFYDSQVVPGGQAVVGLEYGNIGGYENDVVLWCNIPDQASFSSSQPPADFVDPDGHAARWDLGDLASGDSGGIDFTVDIDEGLPPGVDFELLCSIHDHTGGVAGDTVITLNTIDALVIFEDGFESGDTSEWTDSVPRFVSDSVSWRGTPSAPQRARRPPEEPQPSIEAEP
jgi:hypothetical protein